MNQPNWVLEATETSQRPKYLFSSASGVAIYRVHNNGPSTIIVNEGVRLRAGETIDIRQNQIRVSLADGETKIASGWYQFIDASTP